MIGGSIAGKTQVISTRIYEFVEQMDWPAAHSLAGGLLVFAFFVLLSMLLIDLHIGQKSGDSG
jgi:molybdate transport system permease protein